MCDHTFGCAYTIKILKPLYLKPPDADKTARVQEAFRMRKGIPFIGVAVDGTHLPWRPEWDYWVGPDSLAYCVGAAHACLVSGVLASGVLRG